MKNNTAVFSLVFIFSVLVHTASADHQHEGNDPVPIPADKIIHLASLNWPPYAGPSLPGQGATVAVLRAALHEMGYGLQVDFYPWVRAVSLANDSTSTYAGFFPVYFNSETAQSFIYSSEAGSGPLGFAENTSKPVDWHSLNDLKSFSIGVVAGYNNTEEFDSMVADKQLQVHPVVIDKQNIRKVAYGRIDLAVIDRNVLHYMLSTDPELRPLSAKVRMNAHLLESKQLFVCFKRNLPHLADILDEGLRRIDVPRIQQAYMDDLLSGQRVP